MAAPVHRPVPEQVQLGQEGSRVRPLVLEQGVIKIRVGGPGPELGQPVGGKSPQRGPQDRK